MSARAAGLVFATWIVGAAVGGCTPSPTPEPSQLDRGLVPESAPPKETARSDGPRAKKRACIDAAGDMSDAQFGVVKAFCSDVVNAGVPGAAFVMRTPDEPRLELRYGVRCNGPDDAVTIDTPFRFASVTKPFTAILVLRLVAAGQLELDAPISKVLPELRRSAWGDRTLAELLQHTAGLPDQVYVAMHAPPGAPPDDDAWLDALAEVPAQFGSPRGAFSYSNLGYDLAGKIAARTLDRPWHDAVESEVIAPLGLDGTTAHESLAIEAACGHLAATSPGIPVTADRSITLAEHDWKRPSGSLLGTVGDLDRLAAAVTSATDTAADPLTRAMALTLARPVAAEAGQAQTLGWRRLPGDGVPVYRHTGMMGHFSAELYFAADGSFALAYVVNTKARLRSAVVAALEAYTDARLIDP